MIGVRAGPRHVVGRAGATNRCLAVAVDEPADALGATLRLPRQHEHLRPLLEERLAPIADPWAPYR